MTVLPATHGGEGDGESVREPLLRETDALAPCADGATGVRRWLAHHAFALGECGVTFLGTEALARAHRRGFPRSLDGAPFLLPTENTTLRRSLEQWFEAHAIRPTAVSEFEDSALLMVFGQAGLGIFAAPSLIEPEIRRQFRVQRIGRTEDVRERFYAISAERKLKHPAVVAISESARQRLLG